MANLGNATMITIGLLNETEAETYETTPSKIKQTGQIFPRPNIRQ